MPETNTLSPEITENRAEVADNAAVEKLRGYVMELVGKKSENEAVLPPQSSRHHVMRRGRAALLGHSDVLLAQGR